MCPNAIYASQELLFFDNCLCHITPFENESLWYCRDALTYNSFSLDARKHLFGTNPNKMSHYHICHLCL